MKTSTADAHEAGWKIEDNDRQDGDRGDDRPVSTNVMLKDLQGTDEIGQRFLPPNKTEPYAESSKHRPKL